MDYVSQSLLVLLGVLVERAVVGTLADAHSRPEVLDILIQSVARAQVGD